MKTQTMRWTLLTTVGLTAGMGAALVLGEPIERVVGMILVTPILTGLVGASLGAAQSFHLRHSPHFSMTRWILASCIGLGAGLAGGVVFVEQVGRAISGGQVRLLALGPLTRAGSFAVLGLIAGFLLGLAQWLSVGRHPLPHWPIASAVALGLGFPLSSLLVDTALGGLTSPQGLLVFLCASGATLGMITSQRLLRERI